MTTRADAFQRVIDVIEQLPLDEIQRDCLRRAIVDYGSAAATEATNQVKDLIAETFGAC